MGHISSCVSPVEARVLGLPTDILVKLKNHLNVVALLLFATINPTVRTTLVRQPEVAGAQFDTLFQLMELCLDLHTLDLPV